MRRTRDSSILPSRRTKSVFLPSLQRENELRAQGFKCIAGVDEAGRGPLAGPVVAAAVVLPLDFDVHHYARLTDSKQLSPAMREALFEQITAQFEFGIGIVDAATIDRINIRQAAWLAMQNAVSDLQTKRPAASTQEIDFVLIDGLPYGAGPWPYEALVKGDSRSFSIAAASVVAKETRDRIMTEQSKMFPAYGFERHKGYPSPLHLEALQKRGPCELHRKTFGPVRHVIEARS